RLIREFSAVVEICEDTVMRQNISVAILGVSLALGGLCRAADVPKVIAAGDWSKPVADNRGRAVRGRLVLCQHPRSDDLREVAVYVELQDASESIGNSMLIYCDFGKTDFRPEYKAGLQTRLLDKDKKPVKPEPFAFSGGIPQSEWITLPPDGTIRLRSSRFGIRRAKGLAISPDGGGLWFIGEDDPHEYFLSGTFTVDPGADRMPPSGEGEVWRGVIELPAARIVAGGEAAADAGRIEKAIAYVRERYKVPTERIDDRTIGVIWENGAEQEFGKLRNHLQKEFGVEVRVTAQE
ncbi:MAG: hypothetical protein ACREUU_21555, partial [Gammaproteobacteria bacterium]